MGNPCRGFRGQEQGPEEERLAVRSPGPTCQVGVVGGVDVVVVQGLSHVLVEGVAGWIEDVSVLRAEVAEEAVQAQHMPQFACGVEWLE